MTWIVWSIVVLVVTGVMACVYRRGKDAGSFIGGGGCVAAGALGLYGTVKCLLVHQTESKWEPWNVPLGSFTVGVDSLSALFLLPLFLVGATAAWVALRRLPGDYAANRPHEHWLLFNGTLAAAALAIIARNAVLFLFAWEAMTVASFLLVENDPRDRSARGGWVYLTAGHIGGACLFAMFALMGGAGGKLDFTTLKAAGMAMSAVFLLAYAGFGGKIGLAPFHAWYPESYPQAPAHVGALLSGVVGNMGVYGLFRVLLLLAEGEPPPAWWGYLLLAGGLASGVIGAVRSLASRDLSRLLAWSSVENYGLMGAGLGLGLLGAASGHATVSYLGFAAALFHMLNHSLSKALLFFAAGSVYARTGTRNLDAMGGLAKRLPLTAALFLVGALGAASIPPLNGFASEFLLMIAAYFGAAGYEPASVGAATMFCALIVMAVIGCLAAAAYLKAFGFIFLGNAKGPGASSGGAERRALLFPHCLLALAAIGVAALSPMLLQIIGRGAGTLVRHYVRMELELRPEGPLDGAWLGSGLLAGCLAAVFVLRWLLVRGKAKAAGPTWDCGYAAPDSRMQYTASSFARPLADTFQAVAGVRDAETPPQGLFPRQASFRSALPGVERAWGFSQLFRLMSRLASRVRVLQAGRVHVYLLYMAAVLVILLIWKL